MRVLAMLAALLLTAGCVGPDPAEQAVGFCDDNVPVFVGSTTDSGIIVAADTPDQRWDSYESAGCVLARTGAPRTMGADIDQTLDGQVRRASWDGWDAVWSVDDTYGVTLTVTPH